MSKTSLIDPHGGSLVNRLISGDQATKLQSEAASLPAITLSDKQACDLEMIAIGAFSPLEGFVGKDDFESICKNMRTADGVAWPIPITLAVDDATKASIEPGSRVALYHRDSTLLAVMDVNEVYSHDKKLEIPNVFGTEDEAHPGVAAVMG